MENWVALSGLDGGRINVARLHCWFIDFAVDNRYVLPERRRILMRFCHSVVWMFICISSVFAQDSLQKKSAQSMRIVPRSQQQNMKADAQKEAANNGDVALSRFFDDTEGALLAGDVDFFASHFSTSVILNLRDAENGSFSANQAFYVFRNYLRNRKIVHLDLAQGGGNRSNPYASGVAGVNVQGARESMNVYIEARKTGNGWVIVQITFS